MRTIIKQIKGTVSVSSATDLESIGFNAAKRVGLNPSAVVEIEPGVALVIFDSEESAPDRKKSKLLTAALKASGASYAQDMPIGYDYMGLGDNASYFKFGV